MAVAVENGDQSRFGARGERNNLISSVEPCEFLILTAALEDYALALRLADDPLSGLQTCEV